MSHTERDYPIEKAYWRSSGEGYQVAAMSKAEATCVEVTVAGHRYHPRFSFTLPDQDDDCNKLVNALKLAFDAGKSARSREIRNLL